MTPARSTVVRCTLYGAILPGWLPVAQRPQTASQHPGSPPLLILMAKSFSRQPIW